MSRPNLFIVGAPKCGTSSLAAYLARHPDIYVARKELHYFGADLTLRREQRLSWDEYCSYFSKAGSQRYLCDASVFYLYSRSAAREIFDTAPEAKIVIMLRNPVDMMYSLYRQALFNAEEVLPDFEAALEAEARRSRGQDIPAQTRRVQSLLYRGAASYTDQVQRYVDVFGHDGIHVIVFEELAAGPRAAYLATLRFLDVDDDGAQEFPVVNSGDKAVRHARLSRLLRDPPRAVRRIGRMAVPNRQLRLHLGDAIVWPVIRADTVRARFPGIEPSLRAQLSREFAEEERRLALLLGRSLPWNLAEGGQNISDQANRAG